MICPKCGDGSGVYNGFEKDGTYIRRRKCLACGHRFITVEAVMDVEVQGNGKRGGKRVAWDKLMAEKGGRSE